MVLAFTIPFLMFILSVSFCGEIHAALNEYVLTIVYIIFVNASISSFVVPPLLPRREALETEFVSLPILGRHITVHVCEIDGHEMFGIDTQKNGHRMGGSEDI